MHKHTPAMEAFPPLRKRIDALGLLPHEASSAISGPKMALDVSRPYNPVWEQDYTKAAHSMSMRHSSCRAIMHSLSEVSN